MNQLFFQLNIKPENVEDLKTTHIFVVGDLILDHYIRGQVIRISPEAPVPVLKEGAHHYVLGGAGNVAANISHFGAKAQLAGRICDDADGRNFKVLCDVAHIDTKGLILSNLIQTTRKTRVLSGYQQLLRLDSEEIADLSSAEEDRILSQAKLFCETSQRRAMILSDYGKGVLTTKLITQLIALGKQTGTPVVIDPKSVDIARYAHATLIKPNLSEGRAALQASTPGIKFNNFEDEIKAIAAAIFQRSQVKYLVLSLSDRGVAFF